MTAACLLPLFVAAVAVDAEPPACGDPVEDRSPDPRCGERLDGRAPAEPGPTAGKVLLTPPRLVSRAVFWPFLTVGDVVESHHVLAWMEALLTTADGLIGVRPELHYTTGFLPTAGARLFDRRLPGAGSELTLRFQTAGSGATVGEAELAGPDWLGLTLATAWNRRADRLFAGIGPSTEDELRAAGHGLARYGSSVLVAQLRWSPQPRRPVWTAVRVDVQRHDFFSDGARGGPPINALYGLPADECARFGLAAGCVDPALAPGFEGGLRIAHLAGRLGLDLRVQERNAPGASVFLDVEYGHGLAGDPSRHLALSSEGVIVVGDGDRALLLRVRASMVERLSDAPVPFEELFSPSGADGMRAYSYGRFRDASGAMASTEYRWFVAYNLDASLFVDAGTVAGPRFGGFSFDRVFPGAGAGLRYLGHAAHHWTARPQTGVQLAYAPDGGFRLLLSLAPF